MNKRRFLKIIPVAIAGFSGCSSLTEENTSPEPRLESLEVANRTDEQRRVNILVFYEGDLQTWTSLDAGPFNEETGEAGGGKVEHDWPSKHGSFEIYAKIDSGESWRQLDLNDATNAECAVVFATVDDRGLRLWSSNTCIESN